MRRAEGRRMAGQMGTEHVAPGELQHEPSQDASRHAEGGGATSIQGSCVCGARAWRIVVLCGTVPVTRAPAAACAVRDMGARVGEEDMGKPSRGAAVCGPRISRTQPRAWPGHRLGGPMLEIQRCRTTSRRSDSVNGLELASVPLPRQAPQRRPRAGPADSAPQAPPPEGSQKARVAPSYVLAPAPLPNPLHGDDFRALQVHLVARRPQFLIQCDAHRLVRARAENQRGNSSWTLCYPQHRLSSASERRDGRTSVGERVISPPFHNDGPVNPPAQREVRSQKTSEAGAH